MQSKTSKNTQKSKPKDSDYEALGKAVAAFYEHGYLNKRTSIRMSFLKGIAGGFGGVIGATVVVALVVWLLSVFGNISLLKPFTDTVQETIQPK